MQALEALDFLPDSLSPSLRLGVYGLILLHGAAIALYLCVVGPGLFSRRMTQQELLAEIARQAKEKQE